MPSRINCIFPMLSRTVALTPSELKSAIVRDPLIVSPYVTVMDAIAQMSGVRANCNATQPGQGQRDELHLETRSSCVLVIENRQVLGILTERDVVRLCAQQRSLENLLIQEVMAHPVISLRETAFTDLFFAINLLQQYHIRHLPILDEQDHLIGLVTYESLRQISRPIDLLRLRLVAEVMTSQVICATPESPMLTIAQQMAEHRVSSVMIVQPGDDPALQIPVGLLTERDVVQFQALGLSLENCPAQAVMSTPIFSVKPDDPLYLVQQIMEQRLIRRLAVTGQQGELLGIVTQTSLLQALNPLELFKLAEILEVKVARLEAEKITLLENRTVELEQEVEARTIALRTRAEREQLVAQIANHIHNSLDLQEILRACVAEVRAFLNCDRVLVYQFQPDCSGIVIAESVEPGWLSVLGNQINEIECYQRIAKLYNTEQPIIVNNIYTAGYSDCHLQLLEEYQVKANLVVSIWVKEELWGLLTGHQCAEYRDWQMEDASLLQDIAVQLAIALQQATLYQKLQDQLIERQQAEMRLRASEQRYASLTAAAPVGIFRTDAEGNSVYINQRCSEMLGLSPEITIGNGWHQALHPDDRAQVIAEAQRTRQENRPFQMEYRIVRPDGSVRWVLGHAVAEQDADGQLIGYVGTILDISDRKQAELALAASEAQSRAILSAIPDLMFRVGADGMYRGYVTQRRDFAVIPQDVNLLGLSMADVLPAKHAQLQFEYLQRALQTGDLQIYEQTIQVGDCLRHEEVRIVKSGDDEVLFMLRDISDRKQVEWELYQLNQKLEARIEERTAQLREQEAKLHDFFENANDLIQSVSLEDGRFEYVNRTWRETLGYSETEVQTLTIFEVLHPNCQQHCRETIVQMQVGAIDLIERVELVFLTKTQQEIIVEGSINCRKENNRPVATRAIFRDITERKAAEKLLQDREARYRALMDGASDAILLTNQQGYLLEVNRKAEEFLGYTRAELTSMHFSQLHLPEELSDIRRAFEGLFRQEFSQILDVSFLRKDGRNVSVDVSASVIEICGERIIQKILRDISDRKRAEQIIQQQVERETLLREITQRIRQSLDIQTIFDTACQEIRSVIQADRVGIFKFYPDSGFNEGEFVAESVAEGLSSVIAMQVHDHCFGEEYSLLYTNGRFQAVDDVNNAGMTACHVDILVQFQVRANLVMPLLRGDELWGLLCIHQCTSIRHWQQHEIVFTQQIANQLAIAVQQASLFEQLQQELIERQQAEAKLTESNHQLGISNEELARATRLKDEFLANMSHELRTPLNAILGMTEGLQDGVFGKINEAQLRALQTIDHSGNHLLELINDILDVAKIESGQLELEYVPISVSVLCHSSLAFIKHQALKKSIQLELKLPSRLPDLLVDERRVRQVLINLLNNAVKFTPESGHITLEITRLSPHLSPNPVSEQHFLRLAVTDTGIGIAPEHLPKLFQPFVQIDSALNRQYTGTGLGLALVKRIVELHEGSVSVISELGVGSCFAIDLPCAPDIALSPEKKISNQEVTQTLDAALGTKQPLILLAEDNEANISTISGYLEAKGYRILLARHGEAAIELARTQQPDLMLMDIQMPGMDGLEAIERIRSDPNLVNIPIIALTALAMTGDREHCLAAGANDYLAKPVKLKQLAATIQLFLTMQ